MVSTEVTAYGRARTTAASSPTPTSTRSPRAASAPAMAAISACSAMPVDDAGAIEVVRRQLTADPIARQDADTEAPHLAGHVSEHDVVVVELHAEHRVRERLDD